MFLGFHFRSALLLWVAEYYMGKSPSKPEETPLECILKNWKFFKTEGLKKEKLKSTVAVPRLCLSWEMEKNGLQTGP